VGGWVGLEGHTIVGGWVGGWVGGACRAQHGPACCHAGESLWVCGWVGPVGGWVGLEGHSMGNVTWQGPTGRCRVWVQCA
jgi:hypothetical protein